MGGDHSLLDEGNKKMINVPIKIETQLDNNLESNTSISSPRSGKVKIAYYILLKI